VALVLLSVYSELARWFPDLPRWVETRAMLLTGRAELFGLRESSRGWDFVALHRPSGLACIIGSPATEAIDEALAYTQEVISPTGFALEYPGWQGERAVLHTLRTRIRPQPRAGTSVALLDPAVLETCPLPQDLREELIEAAAFSPLAATFIEGQPVSFCYGVLTESLWDVSIDTLEDFRRRGLAALCADYMIEAMSAQGRRPVWGALESNVASLRLASKLGFAPVDELVLYSRVPGQ
jgi:GNAT superfamily N-acetyltransferase